MDGACSVTTDTAANSCWHKERRLRLLIPSDCVPDMTGNKHRAKRDKNSFAEKQNTDEPVLYLHVRKRVCDDRLLAGRRPPKVSLHELIPTVLPYVDTWGHLRCVDTLQIRTSIELTEPGAAPCDIITI